LAFIDDSTMVIAILNRMRKMKTLSANEVEKERLPNLIESELPVEFIALDIRTPKVSETSNSKRALTTPKKITTPQAHLTLRLSPLNIVKIFEKFTISLPS